MGLLRPASNRYAQNRPEPAAAAERPLASQAPRPAPHPVPPAGGRLSLGTLARTDRGPRGEPAEQPDDPRPPAAPPESEGLVEVSGRITHQIYARDDYAVYALDSKEGSIKVAVTSSIKASKGDRVVARGTWSMYKGKPTFKAVMLMHEVPKGAKGVATWLVGTKAVPGVGKATVDKLVEYWGDRLHEVVDDPDKLAEAKIPRAKAEAIADAWNNNANQPELIEFLGRFGIGQMTIAKIVRRYGGASRRIIRDNPWALAETIQGIGFATADRIAAEAGHDKESEKRIQAGLRCALDQRTMTDGHCGLPRAALVDEAVALLELPRKLVDENVGTIVDGKLVVLDEVTGLIYPNRFLNAERGLAERLRAMLDEGDRIDEATARQAIEQAVSDMGVKRDETQVEAGVMALVNPLSIITGGPGTGKSTIQKAVVRALESLGRKVVLASPTGRAAKRLAEVSGRPASTCHRLLSFSSEKGGFEFDSSNPFEEDRFIVDEASMVDVMLAWNFMDAVKPGGGVTIVGDVDQLPSVGAGQVLRDLIESGAIPVTRLRTVHRQAGDSGIVVAAARINAGEHPKQNASESLEGFVFEAAEGADDLTDRIVRLMKHDLPAMGYDPIKDVQVLASMRRGDLGIATLNERIKAALNPAVPDKSVEIRKRVFSVGDRVMHLRNDYAKKVYNGELGTVVWAGMRKGEDGKEEPSMKVDYSGYAAFYGPKDVDDVELSWAATVHKSQGCEFPVVIFACPYGHQRMLSRNLLYTAVTRAKVKCVVVGHDRALRLAIEKAEVDRRFTGLASRMKPMEAQLGLGL